ncbi:hypothetical protein OG225_23845 [Nocardia sp. NBC_01377]|uniref:hypothetical protein n=1 Tax=Nocardia sp. NBC_01377 TaxID=2903595 RepID=UPI00324F1799
MTRSARLVCVLLVIVAAAVAAVLTAGSTAADRGDAERESGDAEANPSASTCETPDSTDLVVDLYLV